MSLLVVVAHAPDQSKGEEARQWWASFHDAAATLPRDLPGVLCIDTNVTLDVVHALRAREEVFRLPTNTML